jgi:hypothetical protein
MKEIFIKVYEFTGEFAVASEDGHKVAENISFHFNQKTLVVLDFEKIKVLTGSFAEVLGGLYRLFSEDFIESHLQVVNLNDYDFEFFVRYMLHCKRHYANQRRLGELDEFES